ncbi:CaiB/BaiF CoA transferase family protein [Halocalculus aciditolerans]|uniref:CoA transferase n=1 Tax=Halocalculus aciditolerans TaxID=1383812 RepID=A0A830FNA9_9EURY|nr:CaiB/BaiF CoA-transferase family protein [Halocalculus aciditolerans]GGL64021.1 CoA transferase [Halocalculus aciditolerans]
MTDSRQPAAGAERNGPLSDLRVLELGNIVAGPFAASVLADLGAEVVKIERPDGGDSIRSSGDTGDAIFDAINRNKRSIALDLKDDDDIDALYDLVDAADVFVENLGRGTPERLGIGAETLRERNPELIYLSIKGFQEGPYGDYAGMDVVAEAMSGLMSVTGEPGRQPVRVGTSIADMGAAIYGVLGVMVALRERDRTGEGQRVDGTLFESAAHWMGYWLTYADRFGDDPEPLGASHPSWGLYDVFETDAGWLFVGVTNDRHWEAFCDAADLRGLRDDERFATAADRRANKQALLETVQERLRGGDRAALFDALADAGVPAAPVNDPSDLADDPGLDAAGSLARFHATHDGESVPEQTVMAPVSGERFGPEQYRDPPDIGEHTEEILRDWLLSDEEQETLAAEGGDD